MNRSQALLRLARPFPWLCRSLITLSIKGYIPPLHRNAFRLLAAELFEHEGFPIWHSRYKLTIPREFVWTHLKGMNYLDFEPATRRKIWALLRPGFVVVDVGANIGYYTLLAAEAVGPRGKVHAVECDPRNLKVLQSNIEKNQLSNVQIHPFAAAGTRATQKLTFSPFGLTAFSSAGPDTGKGATLDVEGIPLDEVIPSPVHLVKLDVDGFEVNALNGMKRILSNNPQLRLIVEWAPTLTADDGRDPFEVPTWIEEAGLRQISILDSHHPQLSFEQAKQMVRSKALPPTWACNLLAHR
jgi:FkbM family methyltransferase